MHIQPKIVFFDIDGTLLKFHHTEPSPRVREALRKLKEKGILVFAASGRPNYIIPDFGFDGTIGFNGALSLLQDGTVLDSLPMKEEEIRTLVRRAQDLEKPVLLCGQHDMAANFTEPLLESYMKIASQTVQVDPDYVNRLTQPVYEALTAISPAQAQSLTEDLPGVHFTSWVDFAVDVVHRDADKGSALKRVCARLGIPVEQSMAFGDALNDLELLQAAGTSIAMGNAQPGLKAIADIITDPVEEDGVWQELVRQGIIEA